MNTEHFTRTDFIREMLEFFRVKEEQQKKEFKIYDEVLTTNEDVDWYKFKKFIFKNIQSRYSMPAPSYFLELLPNFIIRPNGLVGDKIKFTLKGNNTTYNEIEFTEVSWAKTSYNDIRHKFGNNIVKIQRIPKDND